jgi:hypothetical protein
MSEGCWELNKSLELNKISNNSLSVLSVFSVFSVVNHAGIGIFENPQDCGKIHAVLGQIGSLLGRVEFQLHASNVCLINSYVKPPPDGLPLGSANVPVGFGWLDPNISCGRLGTTFRHPRQRGFFLPRSFRNLLDRSE